MFATIDDLILARAADMAQHNGGAVGPAFIMGAASQLQAEIISARDRLLVVPAGSAHVGAEQPATDDVVTDGEVAEPTDPAPAAAEGEKVEPASARPARGRKSS